MPPKFTDEVTRRRSITEIREALTEFGHRAGCQLLAAGGDPFSSVIMTKVYQGGITDKPFGGLGIQVLSNGEGFEVGELDDDSLGEIEDDVEPLRFKSAAAAVAYIIRQSGIVVLEAKKATP